MTDLTKLDISATNGWIPKPLIDNGDGTWSEQVTAYPPVKLITDNDGAYSRLRVDVGQTGFWAGREFRVCHELNIPTGTTQVIKIVTPVNAILYGYQIDLTLSQLRVSLMTGGTEGGTFGTAITKLTTNAMTTASGYPSAVVLTTGGTHTGGTVIDAFDIISGSNINKAVVQQIGNDDPLGFAPGTYYIKLQNTNGAAALGFLKLRWEERP